MSADARLNKSSRARITSLGLLPMATEPGVPRVVSQYIDIPRVPFSFRALSCVAYSHSSDVTTLHIAVLSFREASRPS